MFAPAQPIVSQIKSTAQQQAMDYAKSLLTSALMPTTEAKPPMPPRNALGKVNAAAAALAHSSNSVGQSEKGKSTPAKASGPGSKGGSTPSEGGGAGSGPAPSKDRNQPSDPSLEGPMCKPSDSDGQMCKPDPESVPPAGDSDEGPMCKATEKSEIGKIPPCPEEAPIKSDTEDAWCRDTYSEQHGEHGGMTEYRSYGTGTTGGQQCIYNSDGTINDGTDSRTGKYRGTVDRVGPAIGENSDGTCSNGSVSTTRHLAADYVPYKIDADHYNSVQECMRESGVPSGSTGSGEFQSGISDKNLDAEYDKCETKQTEKDLYRALGATHPDDVI